MTAALFVTESTVYRSLGLDCWPESRDARQYRGPDPVVAHPPCKRWGRYWSGGPSAKVRRHRGDDLGCFASALWSVRTFGGVIEHPACSSAWRWFGLPKPVRIGGWSEPDSFGGRSCHVEQGHYGHLAPKPTWLYLVAGEYPELAWGPSGAKGRLDRYRAGKSDPEGHRRLSAKQNLETPKAFARLLVRLVS